MSLSPLLTIPPLGPMPQTYARITRKLAELQTSIANVHIELIDDRDDGGSLALGLNISTKAGKCFCVRTTEPTAALEQIALNLELMHAAKSITPLALDDGHKEDGE